MRDVLYYFHRRQSTKAPPDPTKDPPKQPGGQWKCRDGQPADEIELLAFLQEPGTLQIQLGEQTLTRAAEAGITSFTVPLVEGTPEFKLVRGGKTLIHTRSRWIISDSIVWSDLMYYAGCSSREPNLALLPPQPAGAVLSLRCNQTWGPLVYDASPSRHHGRLSDPNAITNVSGRDGNGLYFGDSKVGDRFVAITSGPSLQHTQFTLCAWVKPAAQAGGVLFDKRNRETKQGYALGIDNGHLWLALGDGRRVIETRAPLTIQPHEWHFVAVTFDGTTATFFVDGRRVASQPVGAFTIGHDDTELRLGSGLQWLAG